MPKRRSRERLRTLTIEKQQEIFKRHRLRRLDNLRRTEKFIVDNFRRYIMDRLASEELARQISVETYPTTRIKLLKASVTRYRLAYVGVLTNRPDYTTKTEVRNNYHKSMWLKLRRLIRDIYNYITTLLHRFYPMDTVKVVNDIIDMYRFDISLRLRSNIYQALALYSNRFVDKLIQTGIESWISERDLRDLILSLLDEIGKQMQVSKDVIAIPQEIMNTYYSLIRMFMMNYVAYCQPMPCRRTQLMMRLSTLTLTKYKGLRMRIYVLRWLRRELMSSPYLTSDRILDIHFIDFLLRKRAGDIISTMTVSGDYDSLLPTVRVPLYRDHNANPHDFVRLTTAIYANFIHADGLARAIGRPENSNGIGDCSLYIRLLPPRNYVKTLIDRYDRELWKVFRVQ